jgi:curved DNA-binding protein CbpA
VPTNHDPYQDLGVGRDASPEEIKAAYRRRAKKTHPDAGGKTEEFQAVNAAYQVLADPARRKHFDETGDTGHGQPVDEEAQILNMVGLLIFQIIEQVDVASNDVIEIARQQVKSAIADTKTQRKQHQKAIAKRERAAKRLTRKSGDNRIGMMIEAEIEKMKAGLLQGDKAIELRERMLKFLDDYRYEVDREREPESEFTIRMWNAQ